VAIAIENRAGDPRVEGRAGPRVVASGRGALAEQILQIAFDRGIKVRSDADLAEILATVEVESEIPLEALSAVAEILSYVYRTQSKIAAAKVTGPKVSGPKVSGAEAAGESGA
jgi:flagellar biosynthesis protein